VAQPPTPEEQNDEDPWEEERSWRDPSAHNIRAVVIEWNDDELNHKRILKVCNEGITCVFF